jgi:hypothetical protein
MSVRYQLPCENCGRVHPVETGQAGGMIFCECGTKVKIPTMMRIKRLQPWDEASDDEESEKKDEQPTEAAPGEDADRKTTSSVSDTPSSTTADSAGQPKERRKLSARRRGLFVVASLFCIASTFVACNWLRTPPPVAVFFKQVDYQLSDGRRIRRDTTPVSITDYNFFYFTDYSDPDRRVYLVDDELIDRMSNFVTIEYFENLKEIEMSDAFYENYDAIKTRYLLTAAGFGIVALVSLIVALYALFAKESNKQVGLIRGAEWK